MGLADKLKSIKTKPTTSSGLASKLSALKNRQTVTEPSKAIEPIESPAVSPSRAPLRKPDFLSKLTEARSFPISEAPTKPTTPLLSGVGGRGARNERARGTAVSSTDMLAKRQEKETRERELNEFTRNIAKEVSFLPKRTKDTPFGERPVARTFQEMESGGHVLPTPDDPEYKTYQQSYKGYTAKEQAFGAGAVEATAPFKPKGLVSEALETAKKFEPGKFTAGKIAGELGEQALLYTGANSLLAKAGKTALGSKIGQKATSALGAFGAEQAGQLGVDILAQAPREFTEFITNNKPITENAQTWLKNRGIDILINAGIGGLSALSKSYKQGNNATRQAIEQQASNLSPQDQLTVLGRQLDDAVTPAVKDVQAEPLLKSEIGPVRAVDNTVDSVGNIQPLLRDDTARTTLELPRAAREVPQLPAIENIGDASTFRGKVVRDIPKDKKTISQTVQKLNTQFIDDLANLKTLEKDIKGGISSAEDSIYKTARLHKGAPEKASEFIRTELEPVIKSFESTGGNYKDLGDYALAVHAKDVNAAGLKSGFTDAEIRSTLDNLYTPEIEQARQQLLGISNKLLDDLKTANMLSEGQVNALKGKWENYMPLARSFDDNKVDFARGLSGAFSNVSSPIKKLTGSSRKVLDPIESMIKNIYKTTDAIAKNEVGVQLAKLNDIDVNNNFIRKLDAGENVGRKNVVNVTIDGKRVPFEVEPEIFKTFNNLDKESSNMLINILAKPASVLRAGATLTPEFAVRNPFRDIQNAFVVSESGFNPITDFAAGLASTIKKDELYSQWLKESGGYGNILSMDRAAHKKVVEQIVKQPVTKKFVNVMSPKGIIELLRSLSDITESATKVGEFRAALRSGATPQEAAFRSRDLMDFARAGSSIRPANKVVAFLNANIQGKSKLVRAIKENPGKVSAKLVSSMALPTVGIFAANQKFASQEQKNTIDDAPDWLKSTFWLLAIPGTDKVARIPKPFDMSAVANATERFLDYGIKNDKDAFDEFLGQTIKDQSIPTMISGIMPIIEGMANYSFFRESPIIPLREKYLKREDQFDINTSEAAKLISKPAGAILGEDSNLASPRTIDYILKSSTGGLGSNILNATDWLADKTGLIDKPSKPSGGITKLPALKGFLVSDTTTGKSVGEVYDLKDKLTKQKGSLRLDGKEDKKLNLQAKEVNAVTKIISELSKEIRTVSEDEKMDSKTKKSKIDKLIKERNNISREAMEKWREEWNL